MFQALQQGSLFCLLPFVAVAARAADAPAARPDADFTQLSLEELGSIKVPTVVGASKHEQKITEAPSAVSIVTRQDIQEYGYRTLAEVLNGVRGLYVTFDRANDFLGIRGVNRPGDFGGRTLININGHRVNEPIFDSALLGHELPLDVDLIERVEVIRGPGSSLYGNNAFFGIVNIVTREGHEFGEKGIEASTSYGEFNSWSGRFSYGHKYTNGVEVLMSGTYYHSDGNPLLKFPPSSSFPGATVQDHDEERAVNFYTSVSYGDFTLEGLYGRRDKELPNGPYGAVFNDTRNELWDERAYAELRYEHDFAHDWHVMARGYFDHYTYEGTFAFDYMDPLNPGLTVNRDTPLANWVGTEVQVTKTFWEKHRLTAGVEGRYDIEQHQENYDVAPPFTYIDSSKSAHSVGAYLQDEFAILKNLTLNAGARYDYFNTFGSTINPRAGLIYQPWSSSTFKALYGQAYRAPNAFEFDFENIYYTANHDLKPEKIHSYELVWEQAIARHYRLTGTAFYNQVDDLITQGTDPNDPLKTIFDNTDSVNVLGGEAELEANWGNGFRGRASYTFANARDGSTDRWLNNSPRHVGKFQFTVPLYQDKVFAGLELLAMSDRRTVQGNTTDGFAIANFTLFTRELAKNLEFSGSIYNLFDKKYYDPASPDFSQDLNPQNGRTFRVKLTYRF